MNETTKDSGKRRISNAPDRLQRLLDYTELGDYDDSTRREVRALCLDLQDALKALELASAVIGKPWSIGGWCVHCNAGTGAAPGIKGEHTPNCKFVAFTTAYQKLFVIKNEQTE